jgi:hypothetical protein
MAHAGALVCLLLALLLPAAASAASYRFVVLADSATEAREPDVPLVHLGGASRRCRAPQ